MDYQSFAADRARAGDLSARKVLADLTAPSYDRGVSAEHRQYASGQQHEPRPQRGPRTWSLNELRTTLDVIRAEAETRYDHARREREKLDPVQKPRSLDEVLSAEREQIRSQVFKGSEFTQEERARVLRIAGEKRSLNPFTRAAATVAEKALHNERELRFEASLAGAMRQFEAREIPKLSKRVAADEQQYRRYARTSLLLEEEIRSARTVLRQRLPHVAQRLNILERAGITRLEAVELAPGAGLTEISVVIEQQYRNIPETTRRHIEQIVRREQLAHYRSRETIPMGGP